MSISHRRKGRPFGEIINTIVLIFISLICLLPFLYIICVSFTDPSVYVPLKFYLIPEKFSIAAYKHILSTPTFLNSMRSTIFVTVVGTLLNLIVTFTFAYGLTKKALPGRKIINICVIITLLFNAGIVPNYLLMKELGLLNSHWSLILGSLTNAWSIIVVRSFMQSIPSSLEEAAIIDGATEVGVFTKIIIPLSIPCIASFTLLFAVAHWNTYFNAMMYLADPKKWTLQVLVKTLVLDSDSNSVGQMSSDAMGLPQETIRMASVTLAMAPILILYPFLQKYFVKGVMMGAVKE